jgi:hypothetical protein
VIVLIGIPAKPDHGVADLRDHVVTTHQRLLIVAGLGLMIGWIRDRRAIGRGQKIFAFDAGLQHVSFGGGGSYRPLEHLAGILRNIGTVHDEVGGDPGNFGLPWQLDQAVGIWRGQYVGIGRRHVEPHRETRKPGAGFGDAVHRWRRNQFRAHVAEQIDKGDQEIFDALLVGDITPRGHESFPFVMLTETAA